LIYGLPLQTVDSFSVTLEIVIVLNPHRIALYNYAHLPARFPPQRRINETALPDPKTKLAILQYSIDRLVQARYIYIGMDHFAKPNDKLKTAQNSGRLHRSFHGYSTHSECNSVAMGVSAISKIGDHYSQNTTDIMSYDDQLSVSKLPKYRGHKTEPKDIFRRDIIQQLICFCRLDISSLERRWSIDFKNYFAHELKQLQRMQADKLLSISNKEIQALENGRLLVRNICMVFDRFIGDNGGLHSCLV
jgi:oxygen-independent coproporphyrinogen-3 oxidase